MIKKEIPQKYTRTYEAILHYKNDLMYKILTSKGNIEKESAKNTLLAVSEVLVEKYYLDDDLEKTINFLTDIQNKVPADELKEKYSIDVITEEYEYNFESDEKDKKEENKEENTFCTSEEAEENKITTPNLEIEIEEKEEYEEHKEKSPFAKGCGTTMGVGCGCLTLIAIVIIIAIIATGGTIEAFFGDLF